MLIKYFYQVGHQFQFDSKNGMVIPDVKRSNFSRGDILSLLEKDKVEVNKLESLKYWNKTHSGWVEISEKTCIDMKESSILKEKELQLLLKIKEESSCNLLANREEDLQTKFNNLIKSMSVQESRIKDLESRLKNTNALAINNAGLNYNNFYHHPSTTSVSDIDLHKNHSSMNLPPYSYDDSRLDIFFLYSNPLVKEPKDKPIPLNEPIDFEAEINCLVEIFQDSGKKITARFEVANLENIHQILMKKPKILHISCHGAYEEVDGESKFFLYFEDNKGKLDKFDLERLNGLLKPTGDEKSQIEIVFVSACHSEAVANVFKEANVPAVICVHSATKVLDEAAQKFAKIFYNALLDGKSIMYSFEQAKRVVSASIDQNSKVPHCCCSHTHKPDCRWHEKSMKDYDEAHQYHLKQCKCNYKESHMHVRNCPWALNLLSDENFESIKVGFDYIKICCCSPEAAHDESNKFLLKSEPEFAKESPFSMLPPGNFEMKNKNCCLNLNFSVEMKTSLIGRNVELYNVISIFSNQNLNKNRLVSVYGSEGVGKNSFCKLAGKYIFERRKFQDGVIYINTRGHVWCELWFISKVISSLELDNPIDDLQQFCNLIRQMRILIIVNFSRQPQETVKEIRKSIKFILEQTTVPKFLISLEKPLDMDQYENKLHLEPLDEYYSAKLLLTLAGDHLPKILRNDIMLLAKHDIIKISQGNPGKIYQIAGLLQEHKKLEVLIEKIKKENMKKQTLSDELVKILLDNMSKDSVLIYEILYILSILPQGILEIEITQIFNNNYKEVLDIIEYISNNTIIITKTFNKDLKQNVFCLEYDLILSVDSLSIDENVKSKCYRDLVIYYAILARQVVNSIYIDNESATEFSAAQNQGMWFTLSQNIFNYKFERVFQPVKRFMFDETNIVSLLKVDNKYLKDFMMKKDLLFIESIEQLSICVPTILKINKNMTECVTSYNYFLKICEEYKLSLAHGRLLLFKASLHSSYLISTSSSVGINMNLNMNINMSSNFFSPRTRPSNALSSFENSNSSIIFGNLIYALKLFESNKYEEGEAETSFVKAVILYEIEISKSRLLLGETKISREVFEDILKELNRSIKIFRKIKNTCSLARAAFILSDYCTNCKYFEESVLTHYKESMAIFEDEKKVLLQIKCLQGISKWYMGIKNYVMSKDFVEQAKLIAEKINSNNKNNKNSSYSNSNSFQSQYKNNELILYEINKQINEILDQSRVQSHNVFIFIKAHQLVKMHVNSELVFSRSKSVERCFSSTYKEIEYTIDPAINHYSTFRDRLIERFSKSKKELIIKFDFLTENNLKDNLSKVGRVLHIGSDDYNDHGSLFVEGPDAESYELTPNQIEDLLMTSRCVYDLVILAIPQSKKLAKIFVENNIPHVICFEFLDEFIKQSECLPLISFNKIIHEFTIAMLNCIILEQTVEEAYKYALREFNTQIANVRQHLFDYNLKREKFSQSNIANVLLLPENTNHQVKLYGNINSMTTGNSEETVLYEGKFLDLSKVRARMHNIKKRNHAVIGRKREIYHSVKMIKNFPFFNLYGEPGSGKTLLSKEICYFLYMRNHFRDGIFYFDINEVRNVEKIKHLFHEADVYTALEELKKISISPQSQEQLLNAERKLLVVFDNADKIVKYNENQFFIFLKSFNKDINNSNNTLIHFLIISSKKIENEHISENIELPALSHEESCYFLLYYLKRNVDKQEIDIDPIELTDGYQCLIERMSCMNDLVGVSLRLKACKGKPKYLRKLAELAHNKAIKTIDWKDLNLPRKKIKHSDINLNVNLRVGVKTGNDVCNDSNSRDKEKNISPCNNTLLNEDDHISLSLRQDRDKMNSYGYTEYFNLRDSNKSLISSNNYVESEMMKNIRNNLNLNVNDSLNLMDYQKRHSVMVGEDARNYFGNSANGQNKYNRFDLFNNESNHITKDNIPASVNNLSMCNNTLNKPYSQFNTIGNSYINNYSCEPNNNISSNSSPKNKNTGKGPLDESMSFSISNSNTTPAPISQSYHSYNKNPFSINKCNDLKNDENFCNKEDLPVRNCNNDNQALRKSINLNSSPNQNTNIISMTTSTMNSRRRLKKKKQSEILEVEETLEKEKEINSSEENLNVTLYNDNESQISKISNIPVPRPSICNLDTCVLPQECFSQEENNESSDDDNVVDPFIYNQTFSPDSKKKICDKNSVNSNNLCVNTNNNNFYSNIYQNANNHTFSMDFYNQDCPGNNLNLNMNMNNLMRHSMHLNEFNVSSSRNSLSQVSQGQPIIIQNFFNNSKHFDDSSSQGRNGNDNSNINGSRSNRTSYEIKNDKNPFMKTRMSDSNANINANLNVNNSSSISERSEYDENCDDCELSRSRTMSMQSSYVNVNNITSSSNKSKSIFSNMNSSQLKKKIKKGKKSGKMYNKYKNKKNNKYQPNKKKQDREKDQE